MVINAVIQPVQVKIGGQDFTEYLVEGSVYRSGIVFNGILHWQCSLTFNIKPTGPIQLDDRINSALKRGQLIEIIYSGLTRNLRVGKAFYEPIRFELKVEGIDILELFSYRSPADPDLNNYTDQVSLACGQVPSSISYKTVSATIRQLLEYAGIPSSKIVAPPIGEEVNFYLDKDSNQSYVEMAAEIAAGFLYWMEVDPDERIVFHHFREPSASIVYRQNHLLEFRRIEPLLEDPEIICATGIRKKIVLPKQEFRFNDIERDIADDEVAGTREIQNRRGSQRVNYNPCNYQGFINFSFVNQPSFSVRPKNGRGSYINEILSINTSGLIGTPDYEEEIFLEKQTFAAPDPPSGSSSEEAFRWTSNLEQAGQGNGKKVTRKFYRWNSNNFLDSTFEVVVSWEQYQERRGEYLKQATINVNGEATFTQYIYDLDAGRLAQVNIYSIRGNADISELHEDEEDPKEYKTKSRIEKERVANIVKFLDTNTAAVKQTAVEGERFVREVVFEGNENQSREEASEYVTVSERQASTDSFFEYISSIPNGESRPPLTEEDEEIIEAEYQRTTSVGYLPRKKEIKINWVFSREQLLRVAAWFSRYYVYKQNEYEAAVALEPRLWGIQGFVGCSVLNVQGIIDSISFAWTRDGSSECSFRLLGIGYYQQEILPNWQPEYYTIGLPSGRVSILPIPDYSLFVGEGFSINIIWSGGVGPFQLTATGLPPEFGLDAGNRVISGIASNVGTYPITVTVVDLGDGNYSTSEDFILTIQRLPAPVPFILPTGKLDMASGGQINLKFLNYARDSWQVFYVKLASANTGQITSRLNLFGLASGSTWKLESRATARGVGFAGGAAMKFSVSIYIWKLAAGHGLDFDRAYVASFVAGGSMRLLRTSDAMRMAGGSVLSMEAEGIESGFDILMAQSMNVEVGYIEQQVYD